MRKEFRRAIGIQRLKCEGLSYMEIGRRIREFHGRHSVFEDEDEFDGSCLEECKPISGTPITQIDNEGGASRSKAAIAAILRFLRRIFRLKGGEKCRTVK